MYRIVVETGADFSANMGDEAYFAAMVDLFKARFGEGIEITKFANEPEKIADRYRIKSLYTGRHLKRRLKALWPTLKTIAGADLYVWGGGQMPLDSHGVLSVLYRFHRPMLAKLLGTPVMSYAVGAGPLDMPHSRVIVRHCMNAYDLITVRDRYSVGLLREVGVREPIVETVDSAIALEAAPRQRVEEILRAEGVPLDRPLIGVVPWGPAFRRLKSVVPVIFRKRHFRPEDRRRLDEHCAVLAGALDEFVERRGVFVVFVAMDRSRGHGFDDEVAERTIERMKRADQTHLLEGAYHPKEVKGILGRCEVVAGSRMHGLILATGETVPTAGICFTEKVLDFARITGQSASYVRVADLHEPADLLAVLERCWANRDASRRAIAPVLRNFTAEVNENVARLAHVLARSQRSRGGPPTDGPAVDGSRRVRSTETIRNIDIVRRRGLCHFCGTCYGVCPRDNIRWEHRADTAPLVRVTDPARCRHCGLCADVCPGRGVDFARFNALASGGPVPMRLYGRVRAAYLAHATDPIVRRAGASGGVVTAILLDLLRRGEIDGAVVSRMGTAADPLQPTAGIARNADEIRGAAGSVYNLTAPNRLLRDALAQPRRLALVGLGCHVEGLRQAQRRIPPLARRVAFVVGLFCNHGTLPEGTMHLLRRLGVRPRAVERVRYRAGTWPGGVSVAAQRGRSHFLPLHEIGYFMRLYGMSRCAMCVDPLNDLADVSIGDAWMTELRGEPGWNMVLARTEAGERCLERMASAGLLVLRQIRLADVDRAQRLALYRRERGAWARMRLWRRLGRRVPTYRGVEPKPLRKADLKRAALVTVSQTLAQARWMQGLMPPLARLGQRLAGRRSATKDALIGRDPGFAKAPSKGGEH